MTSVAATWVAPCRSGLSEGSDLQHGSIKSTVLFSTAGPQHSRCPPGDPMYLYLASSPALCYLRSTAPRRNRSTDYRHSAQSLARAPAQPVLGPRLLQQSRESQSTSFILSHRIAARRITPRITRPASIFNLLCCQCSTTLGHLQSSSEFRATNTCSSPTVCFLASRIARQTLIASTAYVARDFMTGR
ncbi:hypothetical protein DHEL01_v210462 [Diaporthe helianthi]|uniref:Uncharacterized protein n=1 Tax=Diaporthe helianthi TaxID=158607 RepID=A0A2P5HLK3_DIAHE|nr:hypothetical protein DHEL01_v210462 [Diaporthe helianthi]